MGFLKSVTTHERAYLAKYDEAELELILAKHLMKEIGIEVDLDKAKFSVQLADESTPRGFEKVARVKLIINLGEPDDDKR